MTAHYKKISITDATADQLRDFALRELNLDIHPLTSLPNTLAKVQAVWTQNWIDVIDQPSFEEERPAAQTEAAPAAEASPEPAPAEDPVVHHMPIASGKYESVDKAVDAATRAFEQATGSAPEETPLSERYVWLQIQRTEDPGGDEPVPVSVNGKAMYIPRDKPCRIRYPYYEVLSRAIKVVYDQEEQANGLPGALIARYVPLYPFSIVPAPPGGENRAA